MMRILVTGASGYVGQHLSLELELNGHRVTKAAHKARPDSGYVFCDVTKFDSLPALVSDHDMVIHLACTALADCVQDPALGFNVNVLGTNNIARCCAEAGVKLLLVSTSEVYGKQSIFPIKEEAEKKPLSIYGGYKLLSEQCCINWGETSDLKYAIVRLFNVYGPSADGVARRTVETIFLTKALGAEKLQVAGGDTTSRDFVFISDAVNGLCLACENISEINRHIINIGSGKETSLLDLATTICDYVGVNRASIQIMEQKSPLRAEADITLARKLLDFNPKVSLISGIEMISAPLQVDASG